MSGPEVYEGEVVDEVPAGVAAPDELPGEVVNCLACGQPASGPTFRLAGRERGLCPVCAEHTRRLADAAAELGIIVAARQGANLPGFSAAIRALVERRRK